MDNQTTERIYYVFVCDFGNHHWYAYYVPDLYRRSYRRIDRDRVCGRDCLYCYIRNDIQVFG